jgi:hypothetical protein
MSAPIPPFSELGNPAPAALLKLLYHAGFALHVGFMGFALGGGLILAANEVLALGAAGEELRARLRDANGKIARALPVAVSGTITTGIAPLLFAQVLYGPVWYSANALQPWAWLAIIPTLLFAFYGVYALKALGARPVARAALGAAVGAAFLAIAAAFVSNALVVERPERWEELRAGLHRPFFADDPTYAPRLLHALAGALAVAGLWVARLGTPRRGLLTTAAGAAAQVPLLAWLLLAEPPHVRAALASSPALPLAAAASALFAGGAAFAAWAGSRARPPAPGSGAADPAAPPPAAPPPHAAASPPSILALVSRSALSRATALYALSLLAWSLARLGLRDAALAPRFDAALAPVRAQWAPFAAFLVAAALGGLLLAWLARVARAPAAPTSADVPPPPASPSGVTRM